MSGITSVGVLGSRLTGSGIAQAGAAAPSAPATTKAKIVLPSPYLITALLGMPGLEAFRVPLGAFI